MVLNRKAGSGSSWLALTLVLILGLVLLLSACGENSTPTSPATTSAPTTVAPTTSLATTSVPTTTSPASTVLPATSPASTTVAPTSPASTTRPVTPSAATTVLNSGRTFEHVFIIMLENADYKQALAQPYLSQLAGKGALLANYHGVTHPSYPNYVALVSGSTFGIEDDGQVNLDKTNLVDLMEAAGVSWRVYAEQLPPAPCSKAIVSGSYYRKHEPFISFVNIQKNPQRCANIVNANQLPADIEAGKLAQYSLYIPDQNNDGHDTGVAFADKWLQKFLTPMLANPKFAQGTLTAVTFDESEEDEPTNHIYAAFVGEMVKAGTVNSTSYNHYNLLRTIEDNFGLGNLGREDAKATAITGVWNKVGNSSNPNP